MYSSQKAGLQTEKYRIQNTNTEKVQKISATL